ncbi:MAG: hypothetical protein ACREQ5_10680 [Candidatus Dormibacteria bacterium]
MSFIITMEWLKKHTQSNPYAWCLTKDQAWILKEPTSGNSGWRERAVGTTINDEQKLRFEQRLTIQQAKHYSPEGGSTLNNLFAD